MYKPYSKLSEKEKSLIRNPMQYNLADVTDDDFDFDMPEDALLKFTFNNLTKQLDRIKGIGTYTILTKNGYAPHIVLLSTLSPRVYIQMSAVIKAVFGIEISNVVYPKKVERKKHYV